MFHNMPYSSLSLSFFSFICSDIVLASQPMETANELLNEENTQLRMELEEARRSKKRNEVLEQELNEAQKKVYEMTKGKFIYENQTMSGGAGLRLANH